MLPSNELLIIIGGSKAFLVVFFSLVAAFVIRIYQQGMSANMAGDVNQGSCRRIVFQAADIGRDALHLSVDRGDLPHLISWLDQ